MTTPFIPCLYNLLNLFMVLGLNLDLQTEILGLRSHQSNDVPNEHSS